MKKQKGDILMKCKPYVHVTTKSEHARICHFCFKECNALKSCSNCKFSKYCSPLCQKHDWSVHKHECPCLRRVTPLVPTESVRLFLRLLIRRKNGCHNKKMDGDPGWRTFEDLQSHVKEIRADTTRMTQFAEICVTLRQLVGDLWELPDVPTLLEIFGKMVINAFTVQSWESLNALGTAVYLSASLLDHSCTPNCVAVYNGSRLTVRCTRDIEHDAPNNLRICYVDHLSLTRERQEQFVSQYYFTCACDSCVGHSGSGDSGMLGVRCQSDRDCQGKISRLTGVQFSTCDSCGAIATDPDLHTKVERCLSDSEACLKQIKDIKESGDAEHALHLCTELLRTQQDILHGVNVYRVRALDEAFDICLKLSLWGEAVIHGSASVAGFRLHYPDLHPAVSLQLMKVGKALLFIGDTRASLYLNQALQLVMLSHGPKHPMTEQLVQLIVDTKQLTN